MCVQPVRKLHHNDANVVDHGEEHFADILSLPRLGSEQIQAADFRDAFDQAGDVRTKPLHDSRPRKCGCLPLHRGSRAAQSVVMSSFMSARMCATSRDARGKGLRLAQLRAVLFGGEFERPAKQLNIARRTS